MFRHYIHVSHYKNPITRRALQMLIDEYRSYSLQMNIDATDYIYIPYIFHMYIYIYSNSNDKPRQAVQMLDSPCCHSEHSIPMGQVTFGNDLLPSGEHTKNYGKSPFSPFFYGKTHYKWSFSIANCQFTRGYSYLSEC